jgi:hypothetical protein
MTNLPPDPSRGDDYPPDESLALDTLRRWLAPLPPAVRRRVLIDLLVDVAGVDRENFVDVLRTLIDRLRPAAPETPFEEFDRAMFSGT